MLNGEGCTGREGVRVVVAVVPTGRMTVDEMSRSMVVALVAVVAVVSTGRMQREGSHYYYKFQGSH